MICIIVFNRESRRMVADRVEIMRLTLNLRRFRDLERKCARLVRLMRESLRCLRLMKGTVLP